MDKIKDAAAAGGQNEKVYFLVIEYIKSLVQKGELSFGGKLPSERKLMGTLGLSRNSVREALRSLENMGIVESRHGQGNYLVNRMGNSLGSMFSLMLFLNECSFEEVRQLRRSIEMGAFLLAAGKIGKRFALPNSEIMIHQPLGGTQGQVTDIEIHAKRLQQIKEKLNHTLAERTGQPYEKVCADTERDFFMNAEAAKQYGLVDEIMERH